MSLERWLQEKYLERHQTSAEEIANLFRIADRDIAQAGLPGLNPDWMLNIAYNAALQLAIAALAAAGYRARSAHHYYAIESLTYTIRVETKLVTQLDRFRKKRNLNSYEQEGLVSEKEANEMLELAKRIRRLAEVWFQKEYPALLGHK